MSLPLSYNWRTLPARRLSTGQTFTFVAAVVLVPATRAARLGIVSALREAQENWVCPRDVSQHPC